MGSTTTGSVNEALYYIAAFAILLFLLIVFFLVFFTVRYRKSRNPKAEELRSNPWLEVLWIVLSTILALSMFWYGLTGYNFLRNPPPGSLEIQVHSRQWSWLFEYPDGRKTPDLVLPSGRDVRFTLTSDDVIHGFYVPAYRIQVDAVPGMKTNAWLRAGEPGVADILCTVYCGTAHSNMMAKLYVLPPDKYADWEAGKIVEYEDMNLPAIAVRGEDLLKARGCLNCHSLDGSPAMGPTFKGLYGSKVQVIKAGVESTAYVDEAYLKSSILEPGISIVKGFPNAMPPGKGTLSEAEVKDMIDFLKGEVGGK